MKPEDALNLLDANVAQLQGSRESHGELQKAVEVLRKLIEDTEKPKA